MCPFPIPSVANPHNEPKMGSTDALRRMSSVSVLSPCTVPWHPSSPEQILIGKRRHAWQAHFHWLQFTKKNNREVSLCVCVWWGRCGGAGNVQHGHFLSDNLAFFPGWRIVAAAILSSDKFLKDRIRADTDWPPVLSRTNRETMNTDTQVTTQDCKQQEAQTQSHHGAKRAAWRLPPLQSGFHGHFYKKINK